MPKTKKTNSESPTPKEPNPDVVAKIIDAGVKNLRIFGYTTCTAANIVTNPIYSAFFARILEDNLGKGYDVEVNHLLSKLSP